MLLRTLKNQQRTRVKWCFSDLYDVSRIVGQVLTARTNTVSLVVPSVMHSVMLCSYVTTHCCLVYIIFVSIEASQSRRNIV